MHVATDITEEDVLPARLPKGFVVGGCVVDGWLRDGGMAAIHRAHRSCDDRRVALKLQLPSTARDPAIQARFDREAEVLRRVGGTTHVVELLDTGALEDGRRWLMIEWVDGEDLEELLDFMRDQDQRLELERLCRIARDVARGLAELHEQGVLHLDLKPANVMVGCGANGEDVIKLVDFGIAADLRGTDAAGAAGIVLGTSGYMAPEQVAGNSPRPSFDVYSLGVLMFEALTGRCVPPNGWSPETLPKVETLRRGVPRALSELVRSCMEIDPGRRPATAAAVKVLVEILAGLEAGGGRSVAMRSEQTPVRTGGTEVVLRASMMAAGGAGGLGDGERAGLPVRTGGTQVVLTQEDVRLGPGAVEAALEDATRAEPPRRGWGRWAVLGGVFVAALGLGGRAWLQRAEEGHSGGLATDERGDVRAGERAASASRQASASPTEQAPRTRLIDQSSEGESESKERAVEHRTRPRKPGARRRSSTADRSAHRGGRDPEGCKEIRAETEEARRDRAWKKVLQATTPRSCWATPAQKLERKKLRVLAYAELSEFAKCVHEGGRSRDRAIVARVGFCKKQLGA